MVFIEHRGAGKTREADIAHMEAVWDRQWEAGKTPPVVTQRMKAEHWLTFRGLVQPPGRVLEAGCGSAQWVRLMADEGYDAYGIDFSHVGIETGRRWWPDLKLYEGDLRKMSFPDNFFDGIMSLGAIEHDVDGPDAALAEMRRVLRPGGALYCTVPCYNYAWRTGLLALQDWLTCNRTIRKLTGRQPETAFFEYVWTPKEYAAIITRNGFELTSLLPLAPHELLAGRWGSVRRRLVQPLHSRFPWLMAHMMAAVGRKP